MHDVTPCPSCNGRDLFQGPAFCARGGHGPDLLPGLGRLLKAARLVPVVCRDCGFARFFVDAESRGRLVEARKWKRVY